MSHRQLACIGLAMIASGCMIPVPNDYSGEGAGGPDGPGAGPPFSGAGAATALIGSWGSGTVPSHLYDPGTGSFQPIFASGFLYTFHPDGRYEDTGVMEAAGAGRVSSYAQGLYTVEGERLVLMRQQGVVLQPGRDPKQLGREDEHYRWRISADPVTGQPVLVLRWPDGAEQPFYRRR
jgi:hypothetical protein